MVEEVNGGNNSIDLENMNLDERAIHIHGGVEHNLAGYSKHYSCRSTKILGGNELTKTIDYGRINFLELGKHMLKSSYISNLRQLLKIALELKKNFW
jgi:hypothetical protein